MSLRYRRPAAEPSRVAGRSELAQERHLPQQGAELRPGLLVVDRRDALQGPGDEPAVPSLRTEVRADPPADVPRLADVEHRAVAVAHQIDAGAGGEVLGQRELVRVPGPAALAEAHRSLERRVSPLQQQVDEHAEHLGRRLGVGQRAVVGPHRRVRPFREGRQVEAVEPAPQQPPRDDEGVEPRLGEVAAGDPEALVVEEPEVEGRVVGHHARRRRRT